MIKMKKMLNRFIAISLASALIISISLISVNAKNTKVVITEADNPIEVDGGKIIGTSSDDGEVTVYKGIPFAAPPVEKLRWKAPQPVVPWSGVIQCSEYENYSYQNPPSLYGPYTAEFRPEADKVASEDSLYLNVWTKRIAAEKRPVIVYIHGGGNTSGFAGTPIYEGENIARKDAVYVSIQYRLGIWGFMAHPSLSNESPNRVSGNYAILDQIAALKWVKNNIEKFGGDADNVTIVGQSDGARDVQYLMLSPMAKGLFNNAVAMSGNYILSDFQSLEEKQTETAELFKGKTLADLRAMPAEELLKVSYSANAVLDGKVFKSELLDAFKAGTVNDVNLMVGNVPGDGILFPFIPKADGAHPFQALTKISKEEYIEKVEMKLGDLADKALEVYPANSFDCIDSWNAINQDYTMAIQYFIGKAKNLESSKPTYIYKFNHLMPGPISEKFGVFHSADVPYWLNNYSPLRADYWAGIDYKIGDKMSSYLVNFANTGNPNGGKLDKWGMYKNSEISYLEIGDPVSTVKFSDEKFEFWQEYFKTIGL